MTGTTRTLALSAAAAALGLGAAFAAAPSGRADAAGGPLRCEIVATSLGGMTSIEALVHADSALAGSYRFTVNGSGANISQGGAFDAAAGISATLGSVMLGGSAGAYDARLEVKAGGATVACAERISRPA